MRLFISWSGGESQIVASLLRKYLPCMLQSLDVFMSKHDLQSGVRWSLELAKELEGSSFGIICLTPENRDSPWILFEAGALSKHSDGRACCLLVGGLGAVDVSGPLSQFQNRLFNRPDLQALLKDLNDKLSEPLSAHKLDLVFDKWWPDLERDYGAALTSVPRKAAVKRADRDILEEILVRLRNIEKAAVPSAPPKSANDIMRWSLEFTWNKMTEDERDLLLSLVMAADHGSDLVQAAAKYSIDDLRVLQGMGLVTLTNEGAVSLHPMVGEFVRKKCLERPTLGPEADG